MKTFAFKIFIVLGFTLLIQLSVGFFTYRVERHSCLQLEVSEPSNSYYVYLGDSTNRSVSKSDIDKRAISTMIEDGIKQQVVTVSNGGQQLKLHKEYVEHFLGLNKKPDVIIIPINMRLFSVQTDTNPMYERKKETLLLRYGFLGNALYKPLSVYTNYFNDVTSKNAWLNSDVYDFDKYSGKVNEFENESYKTSSPAKMIKKVTYFYRFNLKKESANLKALNDICSLAKEQKQRVLFYITPIDVEYLDKIYSGTAGLITKNIATIKKVTSSYGMPLIDLSHTIGSRDFNWQVDIYPNEHMNERGRLFVAGSLLNELKKMTQE